MRAWLAGLAAATVAFAGAAMWWRRNPSPCPYRLRFVVQAPHPLITRERLRETLEVRPGEMVLEVGPGTGYYTLDIAEQVGDEGGVEILDVQREMLDHTLRAASEAGLWNVHATQSDATGMPYEDGTFDAAYLVTVLGEVPDQSAAMRELARVLRPGGRLVVGELMADFDYVGINSMRLRAAAAGLEFERRVGGRLGYFARFAKPGQ
ncbi:MAG: class I SAM-dependent methyltransferase [Solirubrobacterales bacterium]|nr:class I SAM-dependent methyltransferase [Solirubrobacterales bacterium]